MTEVHTQASLALKIDATPAEAGAKRFTNAVAAVRAAVAGLEKDTAGAFLALRRADISGLTSAETALRKTSSAAGGLNAAIGSTTSASDRAAENLRRMAVQSANALRISTDQASRLRDRLLSVNDAAGIDRVQAGLAQLRASLATATSGLDIREARAGYADLASQLNRTARESERLRAEANAQARALEEAARAADQQAQTLNRLRASHDPLFAASQRYSAALAEIDQLTAANMMTEAQASAARERAAQSFLALDAAADRAAMSQNRAAAASSTIMFNLQDVGMMMAAGQNPMMLALQQGTQIAGAFEASGAKGKQAFDLLKTAALAAVSPISLLTIGIIFFSATAVQAGTALYAAFADGPNKIISTKEALDALNTSITESVNAARSTSDFAAMREEFGAVTTAVRELIAAQNELAQIDAAKQLATLRDSLAFDVAGVGWMDGLRGYANTELGRIREIRYQLDLTAQSAAKLEALFRQSEGTKSAKELADVYARLRQTLTEATGGLQNMNKEQLEVYRKLTDSEAAARRLAAAQDGAAGSANNAASAASSLASQIGYGADEAARLLANLNGVPGALAVMGKSVAGQIAGIQAQNRALSLELSEGISSAAANRRVQLETMITTAGERGQRITPDQIAAEWKQIGELDAAAKEQEALRKRLSEQNRPARSGGGRGKGGGGGRAAELTEEQKAVESLNETIKDRLSSLDSERVALGLVASGSFKTTEAANLMAQAMVQGGGAVDAQTEAMIRQIDVAAKLNEELTKAARDPVREWMDSVPNWLEAGKQIEMGAIDSLKGAISEFIKTGQFDINSLGEAILGTIADIVADKGVKELLTLTGRADPGAGGLGGVLAGLFSSTGDTSPDALAMAQAGTTAGQSISLAMVQAGQQVSAQIAAAMTQAGTGSATAQRAAGIATGTQIRTATLTSGQQHATNVRSAIDTGAQTHAGAIRGAMSAPTAPGGGGGILDMFGGWQGIAGMALGAFSEGGLATKPVGFSSAPLAAFANAPHYAEGTPNTSGIPAVLHPNEAVIPLSRGRKIGVELHEGAGGGTVVNMPQTFHIATNDADSFRRSKKQMAADMAEAGQRAVRSIR